MGANVNAPEGLAQFVQLVAAARAARAMREAQTKDRAGVRATSPASIKNPDRTENLNAKKY